MKGKYVQPQTSAEVLFTQAQNKLNAGHWSGASVLLENVVAKNPYHAAAHNLLGIIFQQLDISGRAQYHLEAAVRYEPENAMFLRTLADFCYVISKDKHRAMGLYRELANSNPRDTELLQINANICIELGVFDEARPILDAILSLDPDNSLARQILNALLRRTSHSGVIL